MFSQNLGAVVNVGAQVTEGGGGGGGGGTGKRGGGGGGGWWGAMVKGTLCIFMNIEKMGPDFRKNTLIVFIYV